MNKNQILDSNSIQSNQISLYIEADSTVNPLMELESEKTSVNANTPPTPIQEQQAQVDSSGEKAKSMRHPRWTREETILLIEAKKVVENGGKRVSGNGSSLWSDHLEPKWDMVSSFCQQQGVNRTPVQCQKRWGNILSDFRKIKKWESNIKEETESFWIIRNDERRERKLPGFFDREVYNVLDRKGSDATVAFPLTTLIKTTPRDDQGEAAALEDEQVEAEAIVDVEKIGWSTEEKAVEAKKTRMEVPTQLNAKEAIIEETAQKTPTHPLPNSGSECWREPMTQVECKRRRLSPDDCEDNTNLSNRLIEMLRRNSNMVEAHLGAQNANYQVARDQQKEQTDSLVSALLRLTDALNKIADKL